MLNMTDKCFLAVVLGALIGAREWDGLVIFGVFALVYALWALGKPHERPR